MFEAIQNVHILAALAATLAYYILGALWFTPLFGKQYDEATGVSRAKKQKWPAKYYYGPFIGSLLVSLTTAVLVEALGVAAVGEAALLGAIVGLGYLAAVTLNNAITPNMPKPFLFALVVGLYHIVGSVLAALLYVWIA